jgi:glucose-1-phosphate cytidylyltransferase
VRAAILAGGLGTRLSEETETRPKPMVEIGGRPLLWHILSHYGLHGCREFVIALGYKGEIVKRFFTEYSDLVGSLSIDLGPGRVTRLDEPPEDWKVHLIDTGQATNTGGRVKRLAPWLREETFFLTYGDGVSDVDLRELLDFHRAQGRIATVTAVRPPARFGGLEFDGDLVGEFTEKPQAGEGWINGGFFVCEPALFDYVDGDDASLEHDVLPRLVAERQLAAFRHERFWQCVDTVRDKRLLESLWADGRAPWLTTA